MVKNCLKKLNPCHKPRFWFWQLVFQPSRGNKKFFFKQLKISIFFFVMGVPIKHKEMLFATTGWKTFHVGVVLRVFGLNRKTTVEKPRPSFYKVIVYF